MPNIYYFNNPQDFYDIFNVITFLGDLGNRIKELPKSVLQLDSLQIQLQALPSLKNGKLLKKPNEQELIKRESEKRKRREELEKIKQSITEAEIEITRTKKLCLVCRGKLTRVMYICPECETFYCRKCSEALADLENTCWVCNTPIDESKPVRMFEKEETKILVKKDVGKKNNKKFFFFFL